MSRIQYKTNSPFIEPWFKRIGQLIFNFGCLEFESYIWLVQMSEQFGQIPKFTKKTFGARVKKINEFVETRAFSEQWKTDALDKWNISLELAKLRNRIAHNPLMFFWANKAETGEPDFIGVTDIKAPEQSKIIKDSLLSKADIKKAVDQIARLVLDLASLRKDWCELRDKSKGVVRP